MRIRKSRYPNLRAAVAACFLALPGFAAPAQAEDPTGIVSFTVDTTRLGFLNEVFPGFLEHDLPGTLFGHTQPTGSDPVRMDWNDLRYIQSNGWEIGAHGYSHERYLSQIDDEMLELELGAPAAAIYRGVGTWPTSLATPFGDYDDRVIERARHYYDAQLGAWGNGGFNRLDGTDPYRINRAAVHHSQSADEVCAKIETAGSDAQWLVLMLHYVIDEGEPNDLQIRREMFDAILECASDLRNRGKVRVMNVREALEHVSQTGG